MEAIVGKKRGKGSGRMYGVVVAKFCQWEEAGPVELLVVCIDAEVLFQHGVQPLRLPVRLGMKRRGAVGPNPAQLQQPPPKMGGEHRIAIAHQSVRKTVSSNHMLEEKGRHVRSCHRFCCRDKVGRLREAVHDHEDSIVVVAGRQICDPVEGHAALGPRRDRKRG